MSDESVDFPDVLVITMRSEPQPQNATYHLLNVLSALTTVSLVTVTLSDESDIHGEYDVTEISSGAKAETIFQTAVIFLRNQLRICKQILAVDSQIVYFFGGTAYLFPIFFTKLVGKTAVVQPRGDVPLTLQLEWEQEHSMLTARLLATMVRTLEFLSLSVADRIVTYTESMARELGLDRYDEKLFTDGTRYIAVEEFEPSVPYTERPRRVGMIGRLDVEKGIEEITGAVEMLPEDIEFLFVGDGDYRSWIERRLTDEIKSG